MLRWFAGHNSALGTNEQRFIFYCYEERPSVAGSRMVAIQETSCPSGENETFSLPIAKRNCWPMSAGEDPGGGNHPMI